MDDLYDVADQKIPPCFSHSARHSAKMIRVIESCTSHRQVADTYRWTRKLKHNYHPIDSYYVKEAFIKQKSKLNRIRRGRQVHDTTDYATYGI